MPLQVYGEFKPWIEQEETDRLGVSRIVLCQKWANEAPRSREAPLDILPFNIPQVRFLSGQQGGVKFGTAQWFFEGAEPNAPLNPDGEQYEYSFDGSFNQEPIQSHPNLQFLLDTYGGTVDADGDIRWELNLPDSAKGRVGGLRLPKTKDGKPKNPLFGTESWLALGAVWSITYAVRALPDDLLDDVGCIVTPRGNPPTPADRNWLKMAPVGRKRGNVGQVTERFMLSGIGGWVPDVYRRL